MHGFSKKNKWRHKKSPVDRLPSAEKLNLNAFDDEQPEEIAVEAVETLEAVDESSLQEPSLQEPSLQAEEPVVEAAEEPSLQAEEPVLEIAEEPSVQPADSIMEGAESLVEDAEEVVDVPAEAIEASAAEVAEEVAEAPEEALAEAVEAPEEAQEEAAEEAAEVPEEEPAEAVEAPVEAQEPSADEVADVPAEALAEDVEAPEEAQEPAAEEAADMPAEVPAEAVEAPEEAAEEGADDVAAEAPAEAPVKAIEALEEEQEPAVYAAEPFADLVSEVAESPDGVPEPIEKRRETHMHNYRKVTDDLYWVGANDRRLALFENIHPLYHGVSYNAYVLLDEKTVLFDTADWAVGRQFIENVKAVLDGRSLDYMVINHVEPDHAASIEEVLLRWPDVQIITTPKAVTILKQFGFPIDINKIEQVNEGDTKCFGTHTVAFVNAPMVHWPEAMVTFDTTNGVLFSADAFGSFRSLDGKLFSDEFDFRGEWVDDARRYLTNIVGKYGPQVQHLLKKAAGLDIKFICPLHGPVWRDPDDIGYILDKYQHWSTYEPEEKGVMIVYGSMYGNTEQAAEILASKLADRGVLNTRLYDVSSTHVSYLISDVFKYSHLVLASVTYNLGIFPPMHNFLMDMKALNVQNRTVAVMENGSWAIRSGTLIRECLGQLKRMNILEDGVTMASSLQKQNMPDMDALADAIAADFNKDSDAE